MLQINIVNSHDDGSLEFTENGHPSNGNSSASKGEGVHWKVFDSKVDSISEIKMKTGPGTTPSTDVFSHDRPSPQGNRKHWKGTVNSGAHVGEEYNYFIKWIPSGGGEPKTCDPKISIKPSFAPFVERLAIGMLAVSALLGMSYLIFLSVKKRVK